MVHDRHFQAVKGLLDDAVGRGATVAFGGRTDAAERYIEPTVLTRVPEEAAIWEHEIFGPLLPVRAYNNMEEVIDYINAGPKPLAFYIFSKRERHIRQFVAETRGGGVCINECALHFFNPELPFGGAKCQRHRQIPRRKRVPGVQQPAQRGTAAQPGAYDYCVFAAVWVVVDEFDLAVVVALALRNRLKQQDQQQNGSTSHQ
jgi:hypothetical protein